MAMSFIWLNTIVCAVTSEPSQSNSRRGSLLEGSSALLNTFVMNFTKVMSFYSFRALTRPYRDRLTAPFQLKLAEYFPN